MLWHTQPINQHNKETNMIFWGMSWDDSNQRKLPIPGKLNAKKKENHGRQLSTHVLKQNKIVWHMEKKKDLVRYTVGCTHTRMALMSWQGSQRRQRQVTRRWLIMSNHQTTIIIPSHQATIISSRVKSRDSNNVKTPGDNNNTQVWEGKKNTSTNVKYCYLLSGVTSNFWAAALCQMRQISELYTARPPVRRLKEVLKKEEQ